MKNGQLSNYLNQKNKDIIVNIQKIAWVIMVKQSLIFVILLFIHSRLFSDLTNQEITSIFEYSNNTKQGLVQEELSNIEAFLGDQNSAQLFFAKPKLNKLHEDEWSTEEIQNNIVWHSKVFDLLNAHNIANYNGSSIKGRNFVLTSQNLFPSYIVKIPRHHLSQNESELFYYQNISRILYNKLIYEQISKKKLKHIYPIKKCLIHISNRPTNLSDKNYALIAEKITSVYEYQERADFFKKLLEQVLHGNNEALELIAEILYLIKKVGLWDINPRNILFVENYKIAFVDTEKWWYEESDQNFFHQNKCELIKLSSHGIALLSKLLYGVPDVIETEKDKMLQKKAHLLERKLMLFQGDGDLVKELKDLLREN